MARRLRRDEYTVGWVCALPVELAVAQEMLDEEHDTPIFDAHDTNIYTCGRIGEHNVVIACLPEGQTGTHTAATVAVQMKLAFRSTRFGLMVGIGGGVPSEEADIRLGDVVVSKPHKAHGGVVQYDSGKATPSRFERTGSLNAPPTVLLNAIANLRAKHMRGRGRQAEFLSKLDSLSDFTREAAGPDTLFVATYDHEAGTTCRQCDIRCVVDRESRRQDVVVHYGTIASGNQMMRSAVERDRVSAELGGVLCFEMEAAGLMNSFPCLVIRGICDYADSHKNKRWQAYAAATAAACAKEVLSIIPSAEVAESRTAEDATRSADKKNSERPPSPNAKRRRINESEDSEIDAAYQQNLTSASRSIEKQTLTLARLSPQEQECLRSLSFPEQEYRFHDIHTAVDTCEWLLEDAEYQAWAKRVSGLFWIKGDPGSGKSVLMKHIAKRIRERKPNDLVLSFFFHGQGTPLQKSLLGLYRALLNSMLRHYPEHLASILLKFSERETRYGRFSEHRWEWTENELREYLSLVLLEGTNSQPVVVLIDALDECGETPAKSLIAYFQELTYEARSVHAHLKVCLTSRHYPILALDTIPSVRVEKRNGKDIEWYVRKQLRDIRPETKRDQISREILSKANGGFQWAFLQTRIMVDETLNGMRAEKLLEKLATCPQTLSKTYETILNEVPATLRYQMAKVFQWVMFAERPLSAQELRDALATDKDMTHRTISDLRAYEGWSDTLVDFERYVKYISRGLIQFQSREIWEQYDPHAEDSDREAQLIHQSVADFLMQEFVNVFGQRLSTTKSLTGSSHLQMSRSCLRYMRLDDILGDHHASRGALSSRYPLAPYAVRFLFVHIRKVEQEGIPQSDLLSAMQWEPNSETMRKLAALWSTLDPYSLHTPRGWPLIAATALHVVVSFGSTSAVSMLLESGFDETGIRDMDGNTPLMLAIKKGHENIALAMLDWMTGCRDRSTQCNASGESEAAYTSAAHVIDIDAKDIDDDTALNIALEHKMSRVMFGLVEAGASFRCLEQETSLVTHAVSSRDTNLLSKLIEKKSNLDGAVFSALTDSLSQPDLKLEGIIYQLLSAGANTARRLNPNDSVGSENSDDKREEVSGCRDDALALASRRGLTGVVKMLLEYGAPADKQNNRGECPLLIATCNGDQGIVRMLILEAPSSVEIKDIFGNTALSIAIDYEKGDIIKLLLRGGKYSTDNPILEKCFLDSARSGASEAVEIMLQQKLVDLESIDFQGESPLFWAARGGVEVVVKQLLDTGKVDPDAEDNFGRTPLSWAAQHGHKGVVKQLLETGKVSPDAKDEYGITPLSRAAISGHEVVVKQLLDTGKVDPDAEDNFGRTPLSWAAQHGHKGVVKQLLETGKVIPDAEDKNGRTPLSWAAQNGNKEVIKQLLETGKVGPDAEDKNGRTPLSWAVHNRHKEVSTQLLETGKVNLGTKDKDRRTPLLWAAANGKEEMVKQLLDTNKVDVNAKTSDGWTPLLYAVREGAENMLRSILNTGRVNADACGPYQRTPLCWAVLCRNEVAVQLLLDIDVVDVNAKDIRGSTPLLFAVQNRSQNIVTSLLATGKVDMSIEDKDGWTPLAWAQRHSQNDIVELLQNYHQSTTSIS